MKPSTSSKGIPASAAARRAASTSVTTSLLWASSRTTAISAGVQLVLRGVTTIPANVLVGRDGTILRFDLDGSHLEVATYVDNGEKFELMSFWVAKDQKAVVDDELTRIASIMKGKNLRGRALEAMAVISSQTPTNNITGEDPEAPRPEFKPRKRKKRMNA